MLIAGIVLTNSMFGCTPPEASRIASAKIITIIAHHYSSEFPGTNRVESNEEATTINKRIPKITDSKSNGALETNNSVVAVQTSKRSSYGSSRHSNCCLTTDTNTTTGSQRIHRQLSPEYFSEL